MQTKKDQLGSPVNRSRQGMNPRSRSAFLESAVLQSVSWVLLFFRSGFLTHGFISEDTSQGEISSRHAVTDRHAISLAVFLYAFSQCFWRKHSQLSPTQNVRQNVVDELTAFTNSSWLINCRAKFVSWRTQNQELILCVLCLHSSL